MPSLAEFRAIESVMFDEVAKSGAFVVRYAVPPDDAIVLATRGARTLYIEDNWGPAVTAKPFMRNRAASAG